MKTKKVICILGGMGPEASSYMYNMLINQAVNNFSAKNNDDFPEIILHSIPVPDFISSSKNKEKALAILLQRTKLLNALQPACISIACNTAHLLLPALQKISMAPFISMIDAVVQEIKQEGIKKVGILGTPSTIKSELYQSVLSKIEVISIIPTDQQLIQLEKVIRNIIAKQETEKDKEDLENIANNLVEKGAEGIILGCTELPLIFPKKYRIPIFNSLEILSQTLLGIYYDKQKLTVYEK